MRKKLLCFLLICMMALQCACGAEQNTGQTASTQQIETSEVSETTESAAEEEASRAMPQWAASAIIYEVNIRQYTEEGTFEAFSKHLDRLKEMGINTLWFMPIHPISEENRLGTLGSYYSISDYKAVNPEFGTMEDFVELVDLAHSMGFKVMMDWVANHTGWDHVWMEHPDWYLQDENGNVVSPPGMGWNDVAQLNYDNEEMRNAMIDAMRFWIEEADIDGFRCDYAGGVPRDFWEEARAELSETKEIYMLAEDNTQKALMLSAFDSNYNWDLYSGMVSVAMGSKKASSLKSIVNAANTYPEGAFPINFMDNHDKNSWEGTVSKNFGDDAIGAFSTLIFTVTGAPLIYSGQEAGLDHSLEFFEKDQIDFSNLPYEELYQSLCTLKLEHEALYNGSYGGEITFFDCGNENILMYERSTENETIIVLLNLSKEEQQIVTPYQQEEQMTLLLSGDADGVESNEAVITEPLFTSESVLPPWSYYVYGR